MAQSWAELQLLPWLPQKTGYSGLEGVEGEGLVFQINSCSLAHPRYISLGPGETQTTPSLELRGSEPMTTALGLGLSAPLRHLAPLLFPSAPQPHVF